jgi:hypothetical protein
MMKAFLRSTAMVLTLAATAAPAAAQQPDTLPAKPQTAPDTGPQPDGQVPGPNAARPEDRGLKKDGQSMVQPVPGAMPDSQAVPSTISERNAAGDKLITIAWTFHTLTDKQRAAIWDALKGKPSGAAFNADVGNVLPAQVKLETIPQAVAQQAPQVSGYRFAVTGDRVLLVSPINPIVAGVVKQ